MNNAFNQNENQFDNQNENQIGNQFDNQIHLYLNHISESNKNIINKHKKEGF